MFEEWEKAVDPANVVDCTNVAMQDFAQVLSAHLCFDANTPASMVQTHLKKTLDILAFEEFFWHDDPLRTLPLHDICCQASTILEGFRAQSTQAQALLARIDIAKRQACKISTPDARPTELRHLNSLQDDVYRFEDELEDQQAEHATFQRKAARSRRGKTSTPHVRISEEEQELIDKMNSAKSRVAKQSAILHREKCRISGLNRDHFPELALQFPVADLLHLRDHDGLIRPGLTYETFGEKTTIPGGRHTLYKTSLEGTVCVLKEFVFESGSDRDLRKFQNEAKRLKSLDHPFIIKLESVLLCGVDRAYLHMPYYEAGNMSEWLQDRSPSYEQQRALLHLVLQGVTHLHSNNVLHCDIKLDNILIDMQTGSARPIIADFDISLKNDERALTTTLGNETHVGGTMRYMAPEIQPLPFGKAQRQTEQSDIFAFGVVVFETLFPGQYDALAQASVSRNAEASSGVAWPFAFPNGATEDATDFLSVCLAADPSQRQNAISLLQHKFLAVQSLVQESNSTLT